MNRDCPLNRGLVSWFIGNPISWKTGTWWDIAGRNHGVLTNMDPTTDWISNTRLGAIGPAVKFDTNGEAVALGATPDLNFTSGDFSVEWWMYPSTQFALASIVARYSHVASGWHVSLDSGIAGVRFATHQSGAQQSTTSSLFAYPANAWTHGVVSRSGAAARIYFNGRDVTNSAGTHIDPASHSGNWRWLQCGVGD